MASGKRVELPKDDVPDTATILRRVPDHLYEPDGSGKPTPGAFTDSYGGMSTEWERGQTTPETCRARAPKPDAFGVVALGVGAVRKIEDPKQTVEHSPTKRNLDHTEVYGEKDLEVQAALVDMAVERIEAPNKRK